MPAFVEGMRRRHICLVVLPRLPQQGFHAAAGRKNKARSGPISRVLFPPAVGLKDDDHFSRKPIISAPQAIYPEVDGGPDQSAEPARRMDSPAVRCFLFDLAPGGVCLARLVAQPAGELLPHRFTLTPRRTQSCTSRCREAVCFLLHFPGPCGRWVLPIAMSCGARTFLPPMPSADRCGGPNRHRPAVIRSAPNPYSPYPFAGRTGRGCGKANTRGG
jgi:hypothetical protein